MRPFTTPTLKFRVPLDITDQERITVTLTDMKKSFKIRKEKQDMLLNYSDGKTVLRVRFSQEETALFADTSKARVIINWMTGAVRDATNPKTICISENLENEVWE